MNRVEAYLREVDRHLWGMDRRVRRDIVAELRAHLGDALRERPGAAPAVLAGLGSPRAVALGYKELYGYGTPVKALLALAAGGLALLTLPVLPLGDPPLEIAWLSLPLLALLVLLVALVGLRAGKWAGLVAGATAAATRLAAVGMLALALPGVALVGGAGGFLGFTAASLVLLPIGYLPGREKERWADRRGPGA